MNTKIAVFAIIAVAAISIGVTGISANTLTTASTPMFASNSAMTGHLEYTLLDANGSIKAYGQTDNIVTTAGDRCIAEMLFERDSADNSPTAACASANPVFNVIAISNTTGLTLSDTTKMSDDSSTTGSGDNGVLATSLADVTILSNTVTAGTLTATITNAAHPFTFTDSVNATNTLRQAYLTDAQCTLNSSALGRLCDEAVPAGEILAAQTLSSLAISSGDSLTISWTITIGAASS